MRESHPVILGRDAELAVLSAAAGAAEAGQGAFVLVEGPAGIGKTTLLRMACARPEVPGPRILTARGLALESGFAYGIARQLIEPVRASAAAGEWDRLLDGAAGLAARVFDWAGAGSVEDDVPYATTHGLYWLAANLAARGPLMIAVDDAHWADAPSLRWLAHLAARIDGLPIALLLAARSGPDEPAILDELRACPACTTLRLGPLGSEATAALMRERLGGQADAELCRACHDYTGGNPFLLEALTAELHGPGSRRPAGAGGEPGAGTGGPGRAAAGQPARGGRGTADPGAGGPRWPGTGPARRRARGPGHPGCGAARRRPARGRRAGARVGARVRPPHRASRGL